MYMYIKYIYVYIYIHIDMAVRVHVYALNNWLSKNHSKQKQWLDENWSAGCSIGNVFISNNKLKHDRLHIKCPTMFYLINSPLLCVIKYQNRPLVTGALAREEVRKMDPCDLSLVQQFIVVILLIWINSHNKMTYCLTQLNFLNLFNMLMR